MPAEHVVSNSASLPAPSVWFASSMCATGMKQASDFDETELHMLFVITAERMAGTPRSKKLTSLVDAGSTHTLTH